jgi:hypothetical protein
MCVSIKFRENYKNKKNLPLRKCKAGFLFQREVSFVREPLTGNYNMESAVSKCEDAAITVRPGKKRHKHKKKSVIEQQTLCSEQKDDPQNREPESKEDVAAFGSVACPKPKRKKKKQQKLPCALIKYLGDTLVRPNGSTVSEYVFQTMCGHFAHQLERPHRDNVKALLTTGFCKAQWQTFGHRISDFVYQYNQQPVLHMNEFEEEIFFYPVTSGMLFLMALLQDALSYSNSRVVGSLCYGLGLTDDCMRFYSEPANAPCACVKCAGKNAAQISTTDENGEWDRLLHIVSFPPPQRTLGDTFQKRLEASTNLWKKGGDPSVMYLEYRTGICVNEILAFIQVIKPEIIVMVGSFQMLYDLAELNEKMLSPDIGYGRALFSTDLVATDYCDCDAFRPSTVAAVYVARCIDAEPFLMRHEQHMLTSPNNALRYHIVRHATMGETCTWWLDILNGDCPLNDILPYFKLRDCCHKLLQCFSGQRFLVQSDHKTTQDDGNTDVAIYNKWGLQGLLWRCLRCERDDPKYAVLCQNEREMREQEAKTMANTYNTALDDECERLDTQLLFDELLAEEKKRGEHILLVSEYDPRNKLTTGTYQSVVTGIVYTRESKDHRN